MALATYLISQSGTEVEENTKFHGEIVYAIPHASVDGLYDSFKASYSDYWPGEATGASGDPYCYRYKLIWEFPGRPGFAKVTRFFKKPTYSKRHLTANNRAILYIDSMGRSVRLLQELTADGLVIEGRHKSTDQTTGDRFMTEFKVVKGSNIAEVEPECTLRVRVSYSAPPFDTIKGLTGCYNSVGDINIGIIWPVNTLLYIGARQQTELIDGDLWIVDHFFRHHRDGWDKACYVQEYVQRLVKQNAYDLSDTGVLTKDEGGGFKLIGYPDTVDGPVSRKIGLPDSEGPSRFMDLAKNLDFG